MLRFRTLAVFLVGLLILVLGVRSPLQSTSLAQTGQALTSSPVIVNFVSTLDDNPNDVTAIELFDGGKGETDLSDLILVVVDEREAPADVIAIALEGFRTDADGFFVVGGPEDTPKAEEQPFHNNAPIGATHVGLLSVNARDQIDDAILSKELLSDLVILGNDSMTPRSLALTDGTQPLAVAGPISSSSDNSTIPSSCGIAATPIHAVQGNGAVSPMVGETVTVEGIVVGDFQDAQKQLGGFNLQEESDDEDGDPTTSEGLFIFDNGFGIDVAVGDKVRVTGDVVEFFGLTELKNLTAVILCEGGMSLGPAPITLPEAADGDLEQVEGMLVEVKHEMTVAQNFFLGRYGQMTLSAGGRTFQPTSLFPAGSPEAEAQAAENARRLLILDDGQDVRALGDNPEPVPYLGEAPPKVIRAGDTVSNLIGVIDFGRINSAPGADTGRDYRLHPVVEPSFTSGNARMEMPADVGGTLKIASFNVLNYFNGTGDGRGFPAPRGARNFVDFQRQRAKLVTAIVAMEADVIGLMEIENDGYGPDSAIQDLVASINEMNPSGFEYAVVDPGLPFLGNDAIAVGLIYRIDTVTLVGDAATLDNGAFDQTLSAGRSRQPLVQTFADQNGERVTVVVNHFKSKRPSDNPTDGNEDMGPGIGAWNQRRTEAAQDLVNWLATDPTGSGDSDILIIGDLNAYGQETPIQAIVDGGYINLLAKSTAMDEYSYVFDGQAGYLDHALASQSVVQQVQGTTVWHINTDEPKVIDYDSRFNPPGYYSVDPFRSSDHDPVLIGLTLGGTDGGDNGGGDNETPAPVVTMPAITTPAITVTVEATAYPTVPYPTVPYSDTTMVPTPTWTADPSGTTLLPPTPGPSTPGPSTPGPSTSVPPTPTWTPEAAVTIDTTSVAPSAPTLVVSTPEASTPESAGTSVAMEPTPTWTPVVASTGETSGDTSGGTTGGTTGEVIELPTADPPTVIYVPTAPAPTSAAPTAAAPTAAVPTTTAPTTDAPTTDAPIAAIPTAAPAVPTTGAVMPRIDVPAAVAQSYIVKRGDHLSLIARRYSVTIAALAEANHIRIHKTLTVGHRLTVPPATSNVYCVRHLTARQGDTLATLVHGLDVLPEGLAIVNGVPLSATLSQGQQICLPDIYADGYYGDRRHGHDQTRTHDGHGNSYGPALTNGYYVVRQGETLAQVAARFGVSAHSLQKLNGLKNIDFIYSGQYLKVGW